LARSRDVHPDYHADSTTDESAAVNEAYATLRDPFRRADYLLSLYHGDATPEVVPLPPAFLMRAMEFREQLEEAGADAEKLYRLDGELRAAIDSERAAVATLFEPELTPESAAPIRRHLNAWKTLAGLQRSVADALTS
jgi:molecular chaperone HscB